MAVARTYLDFNATAPLRDEARVAVIDALDAVGNPSSVHGEGRAALRLVEEARAKVASYIGASSKEIVFTSSATESNNWVIGASWAAVITSSVEHDSVLEPASCCDCPRHQVGVDEKGIVDLVALELLLGSLLERVEREDDCTASLPLVQEQHNKPLDKPVLVSIQAVNGETGIVQPLGEVRRIVDLYPGAILHVDAVQIRACHRDLLEIAKPDFVSLSAHKIGGPKGVGALFVRAGLSISPMMRGGGQELRRRSGTQNVAAIAGFGVAAQLAASEQEVAHSSLLRALRDEVEQGVCEITPSAFVVGGSGERVCNTACIGVPGVKGETLVMALDLAGVAVSAGSACSSGKVASSHVLKAMGYSDSEAGCAMRISLGWSSTKEDVARFLEAWRSVTGHIFSRRTNEKQMRKQIA